MVANVEKSNQPKEVDNRVLIVSDSANMTTRHRIVRHVYVLFSVLFKGKLGLVKDKLGLVKDKLGYVKGKLGFVKASETLLRAS